jgi:hypothetical protein
MPRLGGGGLGLWVALLLGAGCDGTGTPASEPQAPGPTPPAVRAPALIASTPVVTGGGPRPGLRVDLAGTAQHVRGLERQPDGTYKSVCTDSPEAMRPATRTGAPR